MNPNDIFWLARYAHRVITPLAEARDGYLIVHLNFTDKHPGIDIWLHHNDLSKSGVLAYKTAVKTKAQVDEFAATLAPVPVFV